jgi:DNA-directed RNA polymerase specialized sigma24 family protein
MQLEDTVTDWIHALKDGDEWAAEQLWQRFADRLLEIARKRLGDKPRGAADEEALVVSIFEDLCRGVREGRFPNLHDRDDLWQILLMLTKRGATSRRPRELAAKRDGSQDRRDSIFRRVGSWNDGGDTEQLTDTIAAPELAIHIADDLGPLLGKLNDGTLVRIAVDKLHGYTNEEIADRLGISLRSVERKIRLIQTIWEA